MNPETERDVQYIRRALNTLRVLCGDDGADDADRMMLNIAEQALDALVARIERLEDAA